MYLNQNIKLKIISMFKIGYKQIYDFNILKRTIQVDLFFFLHQIKSLNYKLGLKKYFFKYRKFVKK